MRRLILGFCSVGLVVGSAFADGKNPTFEQDIAPIFRQHCTGCHGDSKQNGGLTVASFADAMQGGASGAVIKPGDPDKSRLYTLTAHTEEPKMPPKANKLPDAQIALIKLWIEQGARENAGSKVMVPAKPKVEVGLKAVTRGKPDGPPPMPKAGALKADPVVRTRRPNAVLALAASPWAPLLAVGGQRQVLLYHTDSGALLGVLPFEHGQINSLKFSRSGKLLLAAGGRGGATGKAVLFNVETGAVVTTVGDKETDAILAADLSPDQTMIAVGNTSKLVRVYATADGSVVREVKKHTDWVTAVEFSPDGVLLATGDRNGGAFVWEANTGREFHTLRGHTAAITDLSWRPDSNLLATASTDTTVRTWEMENGSQVKSWGAHGGGVEAVRFSMDGRVASTGRDRVTKLWDGNGGLQKQFEAFPDLGLRVAVTHDSGKVIAGDWTGQVKAWAIGDAKLFASLDPNPLPAVERRKQAEQAVAAADAKAKQAAAALAAAQQRVKQAQEAFATAQAKAAKVQADLAAAQKVVAEQTPALTAAEQQLAAAKADADKQQTAALAAANKAAALEALAPISAETARKVQEAAARTPTNPDLAAAAKAAADTAQKQQAELTAVRKSATELAAAAKVSGDKLAALAKAVADKRAAVAEAQKQVAALQPQVKAMTDAVAPMKAAADQANAGVGPAKAAMDTAAAELAAAKARLELSRSAP
ncbi:MAG: c-type cytochrome domain-containing protein [Gemmataceae bacterium]